LFNVDALDLEVKLFVDLWVDKLPFGVTLLLFWGLTGSLFKFNDNLVLVVLLIAVLCVTYFFPIYKLIGALFCIGVVFNPLLAMVVVLFVDVVLIFLVNTGEFKFLFIVYILVLFKVSF
jgi:hypothetical protein